MKWYEKYDTITIQNFFLGTTCAKSSENHILESTTIQKDDEI